MISFKKITQYRNKEDVARFIRSKFLYDKLQKEKPTVSLKFQIWKYSLLITDASILKVIVFLSLISSVLMMAYGNIMFYPVDENINGAGYCLTFSILFVLNIISSSIALYLIYLVTKIINFIIMLIDAIIFNVSNRNNK